MKPKSKSQYRRLKAQGIKVDKYSNSSNPGGNHHLICRYTYKRANRARQDWGCICDDLNAYEESRPKPIRAWGVFSKYTDNLIEVRTEKPPIGSFLWKSYSVREIEIREVKP